MGFPLCSPAQAAKEGAVGKGLPLWPLQALADLLTDDHARVQAPQTYLAIHSFFFFPSKLSCCLRTHLAPLVQLPLSRCPGFCDIPLLFLRWTCALISLFISWLTRSSLTTRPWLAGRRAQGREQPSFLMLVLGKHCVLPCQALKGNRVIPWACVGAVIYWRWKKQADMVLTSCSRETLVKTDEYTVTREMVCGLWKKVHGTVRMYFS